MLWPCSPLTCVALPLQVGNLAVNFSNGYSLHERVSPPGLLPPPGTAATGLHSGVPALFAAPPGSEEATVPAPRRPYPCAHPSRLPFAAQVEVDARLQKEGSGLRLDLQQLNGVLRLRQE